MKKMKPDGISLQLDTTSTRLFSKRSTYIEIISALFILLFAYTAMSKFMEFNLFKGFLSQSPLLGSGTQLIVAWALPLVEIIISLLLLFPRTRLLGLYSSLVIMILFTLYITYIVAFVPDRPCNCGGVLKQMTWGQHLVFNLFFTGLAIAGVMLKKRKAIKAGYILK